jgi:tRNA (cmo5U34)-methyltransferase
MERDHSPVAFDQKHASEYDKRFAKLSPMRDALHLLVSAVFASLPTDARILCVGAGTGAEIIYLAQKFPNWRFTAVDPSGPMLDVCRRRTTELGLSSRCSFHEGYLESLPSADPFDAATSLLVSQFVLQRKARVQFFASIIQRLRPGGLFVNADLASDISSAAYQSLLNVWLTLMKETGDIPPEKLEMMRAAYGRDVAVLPVPEVSAIIEEAGFEPPVLFLQTCLIHAWFTMRPQ